MPRLRNLEVERVLWLMNQEDVRSRQALKHEFPDPGCIYIRCIRRKTSSKSPIKFKAAACALGGAMPKPTQLGPSVNKSNQNTNDVVENKSSRPLTTPTLYSGITNLCQNYPLAMLTIIEGPPGSPIPPKRNVTERGSASTNCTNSSGGQNNISISQSRLSSEGSTPLNLDQCTNFTCKGQ
jgi:hypothetical protein